MNEATTSPGARIPVEQGDPATDSRALRRSLGNYPTGVTVVTARHGERLLGMAVNSFAAVSLDPPLVLWSIRRESKSLQDFLDAEHFAINILAANQVETSRRFGAGDPDRFQMTPWHAGVSGVPLLSDAITHLECRREVVHQGGDHLILVGRVERHARFDGAPLLFSQGQYAVAQSPPPLAGEAAFVPAPSPEGADKSSFFKLLSETQLRMSALFDAHRQALGVTPASTRILSRLDAGSCGRDALERATYLGLDALEDALADLVAQGFVQRDGNSALRLTDKGRLKREAVAVRSAQFTEEKLQGIAVQDVTAAQRVLLALQQK